MEPSSSLIISKLRSLCQRLKLFDGEKVEDERKQPQVPAITIFKSLILIPVLRLKSLLQLDERLRQPEVKGFIGSKRKMVVSDSTIARSLKGFSIAPLRVILKTVIGFSKHKGYQKITLSTGRKVTVGIVDGSSIGKRLASVFYVIGKVNLLVDAQKIKKRGKELEASWSLLERNVGDVELVEVDGLYYVKEKINWLRKQGKHILIKTREKNLEVIKDAEEVFENKDSLKDVEYREGVWIREDGEKFSYRLWAAGEFVVDGVDDPLKVAKVELTNLKDNTQEVFSVITTWGELTGLEMKELAHLRWRVENNGFKKANEHFALKHAFIKDEHGWEALMLILFIGFNLFEILRMELIEEGIIKATRRTTYKSIAHLIERSLLAVYYLGRAFSIDSS